MKISALCFAVGFDLSNDQLAAIDALDTGAQPPSNRTGPRSHSD